ncbi:tRNA (cmo5U34)-methyltransferase [Pseudomonas hunanensis]|uniref:tRNA (Cmo5U34)-methyltransferase n=1 Tax=Pseudomonas hunanensis TaxID=1247546 RepID=A0ACC6JZJ2_9PSED|nr:class I SAM-dependent methyltransferase [Pseudomonas hunanensis]MDR6711600.1 tRNA (cmo5U34)-methyltransferase [Pseudomonas hunanensis]
MPQEPPLSVSKFDHSRAAEYAIQSRIALAGYDACHELSGCVLSASLPADTPATVLIAGIGGTAQEVIALATLRPNWRFIGVDPASAMLDAAAANLDACGLRDKVQLHQGTVAELAAEPCFDAATLIGVLHHVPGTEAKQQLLQSLRDRLKPGAPLVVACNHYRYADEPLRLKAWAERWRQQGASEDEVKAKLAKILQGADPPVSEEAVLELLRGSGFGESQRFFSSLFWGAWVTFRQA